MPGCGGYYLTHGKAMREPVDGVRQYVPTPFLFLFTEGVGELFISLYDNE